MSLSLPTSLFYERMSSRMSTLTANANRLSVQIATGKKLISPSDDPAAAQQIAEFDRRDADAKVYSTNLKLSASLLGQADSTLGSISTQLQEAIELATQAGNGTMSTSARKVIGDQLSSILNGLIGLANSKDVRGQPLFGSAQGSDAVTRTGNTFTYNAAPKLSEIPIGDGQSVQATETAARVFQFEGGDALGAIAALAQALQSGEPLDDEATTALDSLSKADNQVALVRASVGARAARVDLQETLQMQSDTDRAELRSSVEDIDASDAYVELQKTMTILQATQASFSKLSQLSLFDYLR